MTIKTSFSQIAQGSDSAPAEALPSRGIVLPVLCLISAMALFSLPFLMVAPNRLISGEPVSVIAVLHGPWWLLAVPAALLAWTAASRPGRGQLWVMASLSIALLAGLLWLAGGHAARVALTASTLARTTLGAGFWVAAMLVGLMAVEALKGLRLTRPWTATGLVAALLPLVGLLMGGWCDDLSVMKEYANRTEAFWQAISRHLQIVVFALVPAFGLGMSLGWFALRRRRMGALMFPVLNVLQTIPSIALFGLLIAPLAWLAAALPSLESAGISGVGLAPGVMALTLYSLLPVVRATLAGLEQVPASVRDAALGLGMLPGQLFWHIDVPLAAPVVLAGLRTAAVQAVGLAAVTALIGAGGLGGIMFEGLFASAQDLVLLGVVPMVVLGVLTDAIFGVLIGLVSQNGVDRRSGTVATGRAIAT